MKKKKIIEVKSEPEKKPTKEDLLGVKIEPEKRLTKEEWYVDDPEALMRSMPRKKAKFVKTEKPSVKEEVAADAQAEVKEEPPPPPAAAAEVKEEAPGILAAVVPPGIKHPSKRNIIVVGHPTKRKPLPTVAHNYNFWGDLVIAPNSRNTGMVLFVEGTSRWCICYPFHSKSSQEIANITEHFINDIGRRITSLITDAGKEWNGIPKLAQKYAFSWRRKNTAAVGHGGMARLDRTVRTLRFYIDELSNLVDNELTWEELFDKAVDIFNSESHAFSKPFSPEYVLKFPKLLHSIRVNDYMKGWQNYKYIMPYKDPANKNREYYVEMDKEDPTKRFKYKTFEKGRDRHIYSKTPKKIEFVIGNKFLLQGYDPKKHISDQLFDAEQLLPKDTYKSIYKPQIEKRQGRFIDLLKKKRPNLVNKKQAIEGDSFSADFSSDDIN